MPVNHGQARAFAEAGQYHTSYHDSYGDAPPPSQTTRSFYTETSYQKAYSEPASAEQYPATFQKHAKKWQDQYAPSGRVADMLESGEPILTAGPKDEHDSSRGRNFSAGNIEFKSKRHFNERPHATWNSDKMSQSLASVRDNSPDRHGRPSHGRPTIHNPYETAHRRDTMPSEKMDSILKPESQQWERGIEAGTGDRGSWGERHGDRSGPDMLQHHRKLPTGQHNPTLDSHKMANALSMGRVDDGWDASSVERGVRRMDLSHNTEWDEPRHFSHDRDIPTYDSYNIKSVTSDATAQDPYDVGNEGWGPRKFQMSTGTDAPEGRWAAPRKENKSFESNELFVAPESFAGAPKMSFSHGVELNTTKWVATRNTNTWREEQGWGEGIHNCKIYKEEEERIRDNDTWRVSSPLRGRQGSPIRERSAEASHNIGTRHPKRDNPTFNSQVLQNDRTHHPHPLYGAQEPSREDGAAVSQRGGVGTSGVSNHFGNSGRVIPTFSTSNLVAGRDSPVKQRKGNLSSHLQTGQRYNQSYDSGRLTENLIDAGVVQRRVMDTSLDDVGQGQPLPEAAVAASHMHGVGKRMVPTFDSNRVSFRSGSPVSRAALDSASNPRHTAHMRLQSAQDRIEVGTIG